MIQSLETLGAQFEASPSTFDWNCGNHLGLQNYCLKAQMENKRLCCGKVLQHAQDRVNVFRNKIGIRLCCFKIGITSNPWIRFGGYLKKGYNTMWLISASASIDTILMLEAALISEFGKHIGCQNRPGSGGEGSLNSDTPPPPPYFVYIAGGRADQNRRVGWA